MAELVVIAFPNEAKAEEVRQKLLSMQLRQEKRAKKSNEDAADGDFVGDDEVLEINEGSYNKPGE